MCKDKIMTLKEWRQLVEEKFCLDSWVSGYMEAGRLTREGVKKYFEQPNIKAILKDAYDSSFKDWERNKGWYLKHGWTEQQSLEADALTKAHCLSLMYYEL